MPLQKYRKEENKYRGLYKERELILREYCRTKNIDPVRTEAMIIIDSMHFNRAIEGGLSVKDRLEQMVCTEIPTEAKPEDTAHLLLSYNSTFRQEILEDYGQVRHIFEQ